MTLRAGYAPRSYVGVIRDSGFIVWTCKHVHRNLDDARDCADSRLAIMKKQQQLEKDGV